MKKKFAKAYVRAGAAAMTLILGSGSVLANGATVYAQENGVVQEEASGMNSDMNEQGEGNQMEAGPEDEVTSENNIMPEESGTESAEDTSANDGAAETSEAQGEDAQDETNAGKNMLAEVSEDAIINENTVWKYLDNNTDPADGKDSRQAWTLKDYDDSAWKSEAGKFGAKKGELVSFDGYTPTVLLQQYIEGTKTDVPTFFFRTKFNIDNLEEIGSITGTLFHDDGIVVYLNGYEIHRAGMTVKNGADPTQTNLYYAGENGGAPKETNVNITAEQVKEYAVRGENTLAVELHNDREDSSDVYFEFSELKLNKAEAPAEAVTQKSVFLTVGSDESSRNLTWYADAEAAGEVQYAPKAGDSEFPAKYETVEAIVTQANDKGFYSNQATLVNLKENTEYVYRVVNGETVSKTYEFKTGTFDGSFKFAFVGDPQIGAGSTDSDIKGWEQTIEQIQGLNDEFVLSAGDQVNTADNETQYAGYLNEAFASLPSATSIGNHDSGSAAYQEHFNLPNESDKGATTAGADYWYVYGNTLFMDINSNNKSTAEHKAFMEEAIAANPDVTWKTVVFHHSVYSTASHVKDSEIVDKRRELPPVFEELGIDVVLMGHDHVYTRTYMLDGQKKAEEGQTAEDTEITNPEGILYLTANSASGSKYYDIKAPNADYSAKMDQSKRRTVTDVEVTDTSYKVKTYYADDMSVLDEFTIKKEADAPEAPVVDRTELEGSIAAANEVLENANLYTEESFTVFKAAYDSAVEIAAKEDAAQEEIDAANTALVSAMEALVKSDDNNSGDNGNNGDTGNNGGNIGNNGGDNGNNGDIGNNGSHNGNTGSNNGNAGSNGGNSTTNNNGNSGNGGNTTNQDQTKPAGVKTGDSSNVWGLSFLVAGAGSVIAFLSKKRKLLK